MQSRTTPKILPAIALLSLMLLAPLAFAQSAPDGATLPEWDRLTPQQREALVAPVRERWNARPEHRARMLEHAQRWRELTPEQRNRARHGVHRWQDMTPAQREEMRALYGRLRTLPEDERRALRERWKTMTPEQRRAWIDANPPDDGAPRKP